MPAYLVRTIDEHDIVGFFVPTRWKIFLYRSMNAWTPVTANT
jgi:hypothetical protein